MEEGARGASVVISSLKKSFEGGVAVDSVSMTVHPGEMFGLIGPDGAGKTTLMRILCSLVDPDEGDVEVGGFSSVREPSKVRSMIGYMPQRFSLYPDLTVMENLVFFANIFGVDARVREERIERLLHFSRLERFSGRRAGALSGGMKQKLALSCVLVHDPLLLVLDEPTTGVDPVSRHEFLRMLKELQRRGTTIRFSTPYMNEAEMCSRVALMHRGKVLASGTVEELKSMFRGLVLAVRGSDIVGLARRVRRVIPPRFVQVLGDRLRVIIPEEHMDLRDELERVMIEEGVSKEEMEESSPMIEDTFVALIAL